MFEVSHTFKGADGKTYTISVPLEEIGTVGTAFSPPNPMTDFSGYIDYLHLDDKGLKEMLFSYLDYAKKEEQQGYKNGIYRPKLNILVKKLRERKSETYQRYLSYMGGEKESLAIGWIKGLAEDGLPEAALFYAAKIAQQDFSPYSNPTVIRLLEMALFIGLPEKWMKPKAEQLYSEICWLTGKYFVARQGKEEQGKEYIRKAAQYGNEQAKAFLAPPEPLPPTGVWDIPTTPRLTTWRHYATWERVYEIDGQLYTESGQKVGLGDVE